MYFVPINLESPVLSALQGDAAQRQRSQRLVDSLAPIIEAPLSRGPFLLGEGFSVADVAMGSVLNWARVAGLCLRPIRAEGFTHTAVLDEGVLVWAGRGYPMTVGQTGETAGQAAHRK